MTGRTEIRRGTDSSFGKKMPCGCYGELRQGNTQLTWVVTASAFQCKHKQGDIVIVGEANDNAA